MAALVVVMVRVFNSAGKIVVGTPRLFLVLLLLFPALQTKWDAAAAAACRRSGGESPAGCRSHSRPGRGPGIAAAAAAAATS